MKTKNVDWQRFLDTENNAKEALRLASKHDPDLHKLIIKNKKYLIRLVNHVNKQLGVAGKVSIEERISVCERRLDRIGAPKYRKG
jgi:hypothetical protein